MVFLPIAAYFLRSSLSKGWRKGLSCPFVNVRHSCRTPTGYSRRKLRYSARHTGLNPYHRQIFSAPTPVKRDNYLHIYAGSQTSALIIMLKCL